jgi:hypothetical protein
MYSHRIISIPKSLEKLIKQVYEKHKLSFTVNNEIIGEVTQTNQKQKF